MGKNDNNLALREKLAIWAGIEHKEIRLNAREPYITKMVWVVGTDGISTDTPPDFPNSLDACFKYLLPEFLKRYGKAKTTTLLDYWVSRLNIWEYKEDPALSFCLVFEAQI
jgi:hypothetical protein